MTFFDLVTYAILMGITGWVFTMILIQPGEIMGWYGKLISKIPWEYLRKPLGECEYCLTGQLALWFYLYRYRFDYNIIAHILFICVSIFVVEIINKLLGNEVEKY